MKIKLCFLILCTVLVSFILHLSSNIIETAENKAVTGDESSVAGADYSEKVDLANQILFEIRHVDSPEEKAVLYRKIADECRGTEQAQESLWKLSQLYLNELDEPNAKEAIACLEQFIKLYPNSEWRTHVEYSLLGLYENESQWEKVIGLYEKIIKEDKNIPSRMKDDLLERYKAAKAKVKK